MKNILQIALLLLCHSMAHTRNTPGLPTPARSTEHTVVKNAETTFKVTAPGKALMRFKTTVTVLNEHSKANELVLGYDKSRTIKRLEARVLDARGQEILQLKKSDFYDRSAISSSSIYEDNRIKYTIISGISYPYTIEFEYEVAWDDIRLYPDWHIQGFNTRVESASCNLMVPENIELAYKAYNIDLAPSVSREGKYINYVWQVGHLPSVPYESMAPSAERLLPRVAFAPSLFEVEGYTGSMSSWKSFGAFNYELARGRDVLSADMKARVHELCRDAATEQEKTARLYRFMQSYTRYVAVQIGIGGWQPFDARYVETNRYGDCKALSNFMQALLREAGIESYTVLVESSDEPFELSDDFVSFSFNHMILYVPDADIWLECTSNSLPPGCLGASTADRQVLLITPEGGRLARTPSSTASDNSSTSTTHIRLQADGSADLRFERSVSGYLHDAYRGMKSNLQGEDLKKAVQKMVPLAEAYLQEYHIEANPDAPIASLGFELTVPQYGSKSGKRMFVPVGPVMDFAEVPAALEKRVHPVVTTLNATFRDTMVLHIPEGFRIENMPPAELKIDSDFAQYHSVTRVQDNMLVIEKTVVFRATEIEASRYEEWRHFYRQMAKAENFKVVLVQQE